MKQKPEQTPSNFTPLTTVDWQKHLNKRKVFYFIIAFIFGVLAFYFSFTILQEKTAGMTPVEVVVSRNFIEENEIITEEKIVIKEVFQEFLPDSYVSDIHEVIDKIAQHPILENEIITSHAMKLMIREDSLAIKLDEGSFAFTLSENWFKSPIPEVRIGDRLDIVASLPQRDFSETETLVSDIKVLQINKESGLSNKKKVTISAKEDQIKNLLFAYTNKAYLIVVVRGE